MDRYPLRVEARRDDHLSRWLWLVKALLLIPHYLILFALWVGVVVLTLVAYLAVLFTGRYPESIRAYTLGVLRWSWRVNYYGYEALGTDRYPPFTLADVPDYPARVHLDEPSRPPRWLPLVAWLFAIPHLVLLGALAGTATWQIRSGAHTTTTVPLGVLTVGIAIVALSLLFTGRYPTGLYDLLVGVARWNLRVAAYLTLLTPRYPPFRLDQGGSEPVDEPTGPTGITPGISGASLAPAIRGAGGGGSVAGPVTALVAGVVLLLPAVGLTIGGGALLALDSARDSSGYVTSPVGSVRSDTAAITGEGVTIAGGDVWTRNLSDVGGVRITADAGNGKPLFVGIAPQSAVDGWLAGVAHDRLTGFPAGTARYDRTQGAVGAVTAPIGQQIWLASNTGTTTVTLNWHATNGSFTVVVANADGSLGVAADVRAAAQIPDLTGLGVGLLLGGILLGLFAVALVVVGGVALGRRHSTPPGGPHAPRGGPTSTDVRTIPPVPAA